jgi:hypothetical protein
MNILALLVLNSYSMAAVFPGRGCHFFPDLNLAPILLASRDYLKLAQGLVLKNFFPKNLS